VPTSSSDDFRKESQFQAMSTFQAILRHTELGHLILRIEYQYLGLTRTKVSVC
jgi:hypothetical protein